MIIQFKEIYNSINDLIISKINYKCMYIKSFTGILVGKEFAQELIQIVVELAQGSDDAYLNNVCFAIFHDLQCRLLKCPIINCLLSLHLHLDVLFNRFLFPYFLSFFIFLIVIDKVKIA